MSMTLETCRNQVAEHFNEVVAADDALVEECMSLCKMYDLSVETLSYKWQAVSYSNTRTFDHFTLRSVPDLKASLQQEVNNAAKVESASRGRGGKSHVRGAGITQTRRSLHTGLKVDPLRSNFIKTESATISVRSSVFFEGPKSDTVSRNHRAYRYMYEKVAGRSEALDDRIDEFADLIQRHYHVNELADPSAATEETTTVVGRIVHDADTSASGLKCNESSLVLESSRMMGSGARVPIRFAPEVKLRGAIKGVCGTSFFPGAIVALRGRNGGGGFFHVEELLSLPPMKTSPVPPSDADATFSMCIACGPFSLDSDLEYKCWVSLLDHVKASKPAVLLLTGPFVDATNICIKDGDLDESPQKLFERHFTQRLQEFLDRSPSSLVLLVPSINDVISDHAVFPQCEFDSKLSNHPHVHLLPNPCRFSVNGISFAVTSVDTLFHLRKDEFFRRTPEIDPVTPVSEPATDTMSNLARNILQQRSFYPIFPTPSDVAHEVNLDITHSEGIRLVESEDDCAPDVLVLPSRLKHFSKVVDSTTVINPSFLSKGSYATLSYAGQGSGRVTDRMTADISRIP